MSILGHWIGASAGFSTNLDTSGRFDAKVTASWSFRYPCGIWSHRGRVKTKWCDATTSVSVTVHVSLDGGFSIWLSDLADVRVFLDVDGDRERDPDEPETVTDADGNFTFAESTGDQLVQFFEYDPLGVLRDFDTNGDGRLNPEEGVLYAIGGMRANPAS